MTKSMFDAMFTCAAGSLDYHAQNDTPITYDDGKSGPVNVMCIVEDRELYYEYDQTTNFTIQVETCRVIIRRDDIDSPEITATYTIDGKKFTVDASQNESMQAITGTYTRIALRHHGPVKLRNQQQTNIRVNV